MKELIAIIPESYKKEVQFLLEEQRVEELHFRNGQAVSWVNGGVESTLHTLPVQQKELDYILQKSCDYSFHSVQEQISCGFLTIEGGHRIGLCGTAVTEKGSIVTIRGLSSLSIRLASEHKDISKSLLGNFEKGYENTLILSPPGMGKTTLLRDMIRNISHRKRVGIVDERGEIAGLKKGLPSFDLGRSFDIIEHCPKKEGLLFLLRSMNPQVLAVDEITSEADVEALLTANGCGVKLLATAHGTAKNDLQRRQSYRQILQERLFQKLISIHIEGGERCYQVEDLP